MTFDLNLNLILTNILENTLSILFDSAWDSQFLFQWPCTLIMDNIVDLHHDIFSIMLFIASIVFFLIFRIVFKFRAGRWFRRRAFGYTHHTTLEVVWTLIPMLVLLLILVPSFVLLYCIDELHDFQVTFKVIGRQWYWTYEFSTELYPVDATILESRNGNNFQLRLFSFDSYLLPDLDLPFGGLRLLEVDNRVKLPVEIHIKTLITSTDVLHSWAIPSFGVKMDACPGRLNQVSLFIYRLGVFYGQCSEICGINHGFMPVVIESILAKKYSSWVSSFLLDIDNKIESQQEKKIVEETLSKNIINFPPEAIELSVFERNAERQFLAEEAERDRQAKALRDEKLYELEVALENLKKKRADEEQEALKAQQLALNELKILAPELSNLDSLRLPGFFETKDEDGKIIIRGDLDYRDFTPGSKLTKIRDDGNRDFNIISAVKAMKK